MQEKKLPSLQRCWHSFTWSKWQSLVILEDIWVQRVRWGNKAVNWAEGFTGNLCPMEQSAHAVHPALMLLNTGQIDCCVQHPGAVLNQYSWGYLFAGEICILKQ